MMRLVMVEFSAPLTHVVWVKNMQTTLGVLGVIPDAFVDDVLHEGLLFLVSLKRGVIKSMMLRWLWWW